MTDIPTRNLQPPRGEGGEKTVFQAGGLLAPLLEAGLDEDAREIVEFFLEAYLKNVADIQDAVEKEDLESCANAAHSLIGSAGGIGALELAGGLARLEKACRAGDFREAEKARALLKEEQERVFPAIRRFLSEGTSNP
jgi:HPt (histidine-containing phosphotransfer) domain-containing protein